MQGLTSGLSSQQMEQLLYPYGRGQYSYGSTPVMVNQTGQWKNGVQPGGVSEIGSTPVETAVAANTGDGVNAGLGVSAGQTAATGVPQGATGSPASSAGGYASIAGAAINQIAQVASDYVQRKAKADELAATSATPSVPQFQQSASMSYSSPRFAGGALS